MSVVGIDLGTTNTVTAVMRSGKVHVLADGSGSRLLPSIVSFHPNGEVLVGAAAKARRLIDPRNTISSHKRLIGRSWNSKELLAAKKRCPFELREGPGQGPLVHARGQEYTLPEISAFVLKRARQIAETALGESVDRAVITVPAHFNELQRASTKVAGRVSGIEVMRILNEPTAAALAYGLGNMGTERVAVYDFGGGTFDCTLLDLNGNVFEVLATAGDPFLGGDDVDELIANRIADQILKQHRFDARTDVPSWERLKAAAEMLKMDLSSNDVAAARLTEVGFEIGGRPIEGVFQLERREYEAMIKPLVDRSFKVAQDALSLARLTPSAFDKVILVGGSTRIPMVRQRVEAFFGMKVLDRVNPDEVVAVGAAIQAAALTDRSRAREIPAPPAVPGLSPHTQRGIGLGDEITQTPADDADEGDTVVRSGPPSAGPVQHPQYGSGPPNQSAPPLVRGARPPEAPPGARVITAPMGAVIENLAPLDEGWDAREEQTRDDPSIQSFPDLAVPTPFEWFPAGPVSSAKGEDVPTQMRNRGPSARPPPAGSEPPSIQTGGSMPSGPSFQSGVDPIEGFGEVHDLSLVSSTGAVGAPVAGIPSPLGDPDLPAVLSSGVPTDPERSRDSVPSIQSIPSIPSLAETTSPLPIGVGAAVIQGKVESGPPVQPSPRPRSAPASARPPPPPPQPSPLARTAQSAQHPPTHAMSPQQVAALQSAQPSGQPFQSSPPPHAPPPQPYGPPQAFQPHAGFASPQHSPPPGQASPVPTATQPTFQPGAWEPAPHPRKYSSIPAEGTLDPRQMFDGNVGFGQQGASQPIMLSSAPPVLVDVSPHALVVETAGGYCDTVIPRNSKIPCEHTRRFATSQDMQTVAKIRVAQGEDGSFAANTYLGEVELSGIRPASRGEVTVLVTFELDADGTVQVRARDDSTGHEATARLQLIGVADESSVVMMINRFAQQPMGPGSPIQ